MGCFEDLRDHRQCLQDTREPKSALMEQPLRAAGNGGLVGATVSPPFLVFCACRGGSSKAAAMALAAYQRTEQIRGFSPNPLRAFSLAISGQDNVLNGVMPLPIANL